MCLCNKCEKLCAAVVLILGILFLLRDLNVWNFWNIQWWTALFILVGLGAFCAGGCPECKKLRKRK